MQISNLLKLPTPGQINVNVRTMIKTFKKKKRKEKELDRKRVYVIDYYSNRLSSLL